MSRATSPYSHYLMIRPELKDDAQAASDLKGRSVAVVSRGAILVYELVKVLEAGGLTLADINLKYIPFGQMATALTTGAVDAALMISPLQDAVEAKGIGVKWINADSTHQGAAGAGLGLVDEHGLGARRARTPPGGSCAGRCAACATIATPITMAPTAPRSRASWRNIPT